MANQKLLVNLLCISLKSLFWISEMISELAAYFDFWPTSIAYVLGNFLYCSLSNLPNIFFGFPMKCPIIKKSLIAFMGHMVANGPECRKGILCASSCHASRSWLYGPLSLSDGVHAPLEMAGMRDLAIKRVATPGWIFVYFVHSIHSWCKSDSCLNFTWGLQ